MSVRNFSKPASRVCIAARKLLLIVLGICLALSVSAQIPPGLVSWWRADGNLNDSIGTNHGTATGNLVIGSGYQGSGFDLGGPGGAPGAVRIANNPTLESNRTNLSVAAWVRAGGYPGAFRYILSKSRTTAAASWALYTAAPTGTGGLAPSGTGGAGFLVSCTNASSSFTVLSPLVEDSKVWDGTWHMLLGTFDGGNCRLYLDGLEVGSGTVLSGGQAGGRLVLTNNFQKGDLVFGDFNATDFGTLHYGGQLDEVMLFNRTLTPIEVRNLIKSFETNLVAWWQAEGDYKDSVGTNHGLPQGNVYPGIGRSGRAIHFVNGLVSVPDAAALRPSTLTLAAQIRAPSPPTNKVIISKSLTAAASSYGFSTDVNGRLRFTISAGGTIVTSPAASATIWDGQFHTIFGSYDGGSVHLFIDGFELLPAAPAAGAIDYDTAYNSGNLVLGDLDPTPGTRNFSGGSLDEVRIFNRALTAAEIAGRTPLDSPGIESRMNPPVIFAEPGSYVWFNASSWQPWFVNNGANAAMHLDYQWSRGGTNLVGLTGSSLIISSARQSLLGDYSVEVSAPAVAYISDGHRGAAFRMNSELRIPRASDLSFTNSVTVQLWARADVPPGNYSYLVSKSFSSSQSSFALYTGNSGTCAFYVKYASANTATAISSQLSASERSFIWDGNWHQLTGTYSSTNGQSRIFIDGIELIRGNASAAPANSKIYNDAAPYFQNGDLILGDFSIFNGDFHWQGDLDDIRLLNRALSPAEVLYSYTNSAPTNLPGTVMWLQAEGDLQDSIGKHAVLLSPPEIVRRLSGTLSFVPQLQHVAITAGLFSGSVVGADGQTCSVQRSCDGREWISFYTNVAPFNFCDPVSNPRCFYRVISHL